MGWNGADLVTEYSALAGDTTDSFRSKITGWLQDIERDICKEYSWGFLRVKGFKTLTSGAEEQSLLQSTPSAPTITAAAGSGLTVDSVYKVKITLYNPTYDIELTSSASNAITVTGSNLQLSLTSIPLATEFFTQRRIYLKKDSGAYKYYSTIDNNTATTATITAETSSSIEPPDFTCIRSLDGDPFFESVSANLEYMPVNQMRIYFQGAFGSGTPDAWADLSEGRILLYPKPSSALLLYFYFLKVPRGIYDDADSIPTIPPSLKEVLEAGVEYKANKYRSTSDWPAKYDIYRAKLKNAIDTMGKPVKRNISKVQDRMGNSDGWTY